MRIEAQSRGLREAARHPAYPALERAGIVFAYLGPGEPPLLPAYDFLSVPEANRRVARYPVQCNYLQGVEGGMDPIPRLLFRSRLGPPAEPGGPAGIAETTLASELAEYGFRLVSSEPGTEHRPRIETRDFVLPGLTTLPGMEIEGYAVHWHVPIDDLSHWRYVFVFQRTGPVSDEQAQSNGATSGLSDGPDSTADPRTTPAGEFVLHSIRLAESQGPIMDRTREFLAPTDEGIVALRGVLHRAISDVAEDVDPPHVIRDEGAQLLRPHHRLGEPRTQLAAGLRSQLGRRRDDRLELLKGQLRCIHRSIGEGAETAIGIEPEVIGRIELERALDGTDDRRNIHAIFFMDRQPPRQRRQLKSCGQSESRAPGAPETPILKRFWHSR